MVMAAMMARMTMRVAAATVIWLMRRSRSTLFLAVAISACVRCEM